MPLVDPDWYKERPLKKNYPQKQTNKIGIEEINIRVGVTIQVNIQGCGLSSPNGSLSVKKWVKQALTLSLSRFSNAFKLTSDYNVEIHVVFSTQCIQISGYKCPILVMFYFHFKFLKNPSSFDHQNLKDWLSMRLPRKVWYSSSFTITSEFWTQSLKYRQFP